MSNHFIILSPEKEPLGISPDQVAAAVAEEWGSYQAMALNKVVQFSASVEPPGETSYSINLNARGTTISTDGLWPQAARVAAWGRRLLGPGFPHRVWLIDQAYTGHIELPFGITAEQVMAGWLDHDVHGEPTDVH